MMVDATIGKAVVKISNRDGNGNMGTPDQTVTGRSSSLHPPRRPKPSDKVSVDSDLLIRETNHRCANDLQLVVSLLSLKSRRARNEKARAALAEMADRVAVLAHARSALTKPDRPSLAAALNNIRDALASQAEPRSIMVSVEADDDLGDLTSEQITVVGLAVNELATNAIKHAFVERKEGSVHIIARRHDERDIVVLIDDDGLPLPPDTDRRGGAIGLSLVPRLIGSIQGLLILPTDGSKCFQIRVPVGSR